MGRRLSSHRKLRVESTLRGGWLSWCGSTSCALITASAVVFVLLLEDHYSLNLARPFGGSLPRNSAHPKDSEILSHGGNETSADAEGSRDKTFVWFPDEDTPDSEQLNDQGEVNNDSLSHEVEQSESDQSKAEKPEGTGASPGDENASAEPKAVEQPTDEGKKLYIKNSGFDETDSDQSPTKAEVDVLWNYLGRKLLVLSDGTTPDELFKRVSITCPGSNFIVHLTKAHSWTGKETELMRTDLLPMDEQDLTTMKGTTITKDMASPGNGGRSFPKMLVLSDAYIGHTGRAITCLRPREDKNIVLTGRGFDTGGGCCASTWNMGLGNLNEPQAYDAMIKNSPGGIKRLGQAISLLQNHGTTYHHVMHEVIPRAIVILPILLRYPDLPVFAPEGSVVTNMLAALGVHPSRLVQLAAGEWAYAEQLLAPPGTLQLLDETEQMAHSQMVRDLFSSMYTANMDLRRDRIVVILRRTNGDLTHDCNEKRCISNLAELLDALRKEFADKYEIVPLQPGIVTLRRTVQEFSKAAAVVGVHGGGFQNVMFMQAGSICVHISHASTLTYYQPLAERHGVRYVPIENDEAYRDAGKVHIDSTVAVQKLSNALKAFEAG